jgi:hypothetical protein
MSKAVAEVHDERVVAHGRGREPKGVNEAAVPVDDVVLDRPALRPAIDQLPHVVGDLCLANESDVLDPRPHQLLESMQHERLVPDR